MRTFNELVSIFQVTSISMHPEQCYSAHTSRVNFRTETGRSGSPDDAVQQQNRGDNPLKSAHILNTQSLRNQAGGDPPAGSTAEEKDRPHDGKVPVKEYRLVEHQQQKRQAAQKSGNEYQALQGKLFQA